MRGWGTFFLFAGLVALAVNGGVIPRSFAEDALRLWPLLLIALGLGLVLRQTGARALGGLIAAATFGVIAGGFLAVGPAVAACGGSRSGDLEAVAEGRFSGPATVHVEQTCGELTVRPVAGDSWSFEATGGGEPPTIDQDARGLEIRAPGRFGFGVQAQDWALTLPREHRLDIGLEIGAGGADVRLSGAELGTLSVTVNAGAARIGLSDATLEDLSVTVNAGSIEMTLPGSSLSGSITVNAGSADLCVEEGVALRIQSSGALSSTDLEALDLLRIGEQWESRDYDTSRRRIELSVTANAGSITLRPVNGDCV